MKINFEKIGQRLSTKKMSVVVDTTAKFWDENFGYWYNFSINEVKAFRLKLNELSYKKAVSIINKAKRRYKNF